MSKESAMHSIIRSMSAQLMAISPAGTLRDAVRQVAVASVMTAGLAAPAVAQQQPDLLPRHSAGSYGGQLGGAVFGEIARDAGTGNRALDRVLFGVATEVGRNAGRRVAEAPYGDPQAHQQVRGQQRAYVPMVMRDVDQMDTLALRTAFSYERVQATLGGRTVSSAQYREIAAPFETDLANFKAAYRMMEREGKDMRPWDPMLRAVSARIGSVSLAHLQTEGSVMISRLQRAGGPGFTEVPQTQSLDGLRRQMGQTPYSNSDYRVTPVGYHHTNPQQDSNPAPGG